MNRYYICGQAGSGVEGDPWRPEIADDLEALVVGYVEVDTDDGTQTFPVTPSWAANQEIEAEQQDFEPYVQMVEISPGEFVERLVEPGVIKTPLPRFIVHVGIPTLPVQRTDDMSDDDYEDAVLDAIAAAASFGEAVHAEIAYDKKTNPDGYDWIEVADDGTVTLHAS